MRTMTNEILHDLASLTETRRDGLYSVQIETFCDDDGHLRKRVLDLIANRRTLTSRAPRPVFLDVTFCASDDADDILRECAWNGWLESDERIGLSLDEAIDYLGYLESRGEAKDEPVFDHIDFDL
jgi:hypothetical protein